MEYMTIQEASQKWNISERRIQTLSVGVRIQGANKFCRQSAKPMEMKKPFDARIKSGRYVKNNINKHEENLL